MSASPTIRPLSPLSGPRTAGRETDARAGGQPPAPPEATLLRPRLLAQLSRGVARTPVTLLSAPGGTGKSTLAAAWFRTRPAAARVAWRTLTDGDDDPPTFWAHVADSLEGAGAADERSTAAGSGPPLPGRLIERPARIRPVVLVIDQADRLGGPELLADLDRVIRGADGRVRLVLCARSDPPLPLEDYRRVGMLTELRADVWRSPPRRPGDCWPAWAHPSRPARRGCCVPVPAATQRCCGWPQPR